MSDRPFPEDELVSAYLDDEVDVDERARVEGDPALMARLEELRRARDTLRAPVDQPGANEVDRALAAALAAARPSPVASLADRRRPRSVPAWLSVAALVLGLLVAVSLVGVVIGGGDDQDEQGEEATALSDDDTGDTFDSSGAGGGAEGAADAPMTLQAAAPVDLGDLGAIADERALEDAVGPALAARAAPGAGTTGNGGEAEGGTGAGTGEGEDSAAPTTTPPTGAADAARCERPDLGEPVLRATAVYDGTEAVVLGFEVPEGTRVLVLAVDSCGVIADVTL